MFTQPHTTFTPSTLQAMSAPIVFFDIAGENSEAQSRFYREVFAWQIGDDQRFTVPVSSPIEATLRSDPAEKMLYLGVEDVSATLERVLELGGSIDTPRFEVPGVVVLGLFRDPAGNRMGLVEIADGQVRIP